MTACVHGDVCREYLRQHKGIICQTCPSGCRFYEPKRERTCRNIANKTDREFGNPFICSECGADPHDAESYHCGFSSGEYDWRFCPNCGAKVIHDA